MCSSAINKRRKVMGETEGGVKRGRRVHNLKFAIVVGSTCKQILQMHKKQASEQFSICQRYRAEIYSMYIVYIQCIYSTFQFQLVPAVCPLISHALYRYIASFLRRSGAFLRSALFFSLHANALLLLLLHI